jgi:hypothetical protein
MPSDSIAQAIERYLETLRKHCVRVSPAEADEFVVEIRSHIMVRISAEDNPTPETLDAILQRVGDPKQPPDSAARLALDVTVARSSS